MTLIIRSEQLKNIVIIIITMHNIKNFKYLSLIQGTLIALYELKYCPLKISEIHSFGELVYSPMNSVGHAIQKYRP